MNTMSRIVIGPLLLSAFVVETSNGQFAPSPFEVGMSIGTLVYQGDLSRSQLGYTKGLKPAIGLQAAKTMSRFFSHRTAQAQGSVHAYDSTYSSPAWRKYRDLSFHSPVIELSAVAEYYPLGNAKGDRPGSFAPYLFAGIGTTFLKIRRDYSGFDAAYFGEGSSTVIGLNRDIEHRVPWVIPVVPVGIGVRYMFTDQISFRAEFTWRLTDTDYLDGFKYAGDPNKNDHYYGISIGVSYRFGHNPLDCPRSPRGYYR
jgi:opacity protein-like surface antigen